MLTSYSILPDGLDEIPFRSTFFSAGEPHIELLATPRSRSVVIDARLSETWELPRLLCLTSALRHSGAKRIDLFCPYFPGGRQDRVEPGSGNAFTAKVYAGVINAQGYERVVVVDPHSEVTAALLDRVEVMHPTTWLPRMLAAHGVTDLIVPDAGAGKRVDRMHAQCALPRSPVQALKHRDPATGRLSGFSMPRLEPDRTYLVVDDICDGGGTFLGLSEQAGGSAGKRDFRLGLYVTHGIFSKGLSGLMDAYDFIWTTDSIPLRESHPRLTVLPLWSSVGRSVFLNQPENV